MKIALISSAAGALLLGCASTETGTVSHKANGPPVYGLNNQPETSVSGQGSLMRGLYDSRQMQTGQFTGQERTLNVIGQSPTLPRQADPREMDHRGALAIGAGS